MGREHLLARVQLSFLTIRTSARAEFCEKEVPGRVSKRHTNRYPTIICRHFIGLVYSSILCFLNYIAAPALCHDTQRKIIKSAICATCKLNLKSLRCVWNLHGLFLMSSNFEPKRIFPSPQKRPSISKSLTCTSNQSNQNRRHHTGIQYVYLPAWRPQGRLIQARLQRLKG